MTREVRERLNPELVLRALIRARVDLNDPAQVGRDLLGTPPEPFYIRIANVGGVVRDIDFDAALDVEVFAKGYTLADSTHRALEGILLGYPHVVEVDGSTVVIDSVSQSVAPQEIPWDDPAVSRILATYVITGRR